MKIFNALFLQKKVKKSLAMSGEIGNIMIYKYVGVVFAFIYGYFIFKETYSFFSVFGIMKEKVTI